MKRMKLILILALFTAVLKAPNYPTMVIPKAEVINPYERIWEAVCKVESSNNPLAYHMESNGFPSIGIAQVQNSRIIDFNRRYRQSFTLMDMYHPKKAKVVFMAYSSEIKPNDVERICREWNGGPDGMRKSSTKKYYKKILKVI